MNYLLANSTVNGAEGRITITKGGKVLEVAGIKNLTTTAGIQSNDMRVVGTRKIQKKLNGVNLTGKGNIYFGSNGSNLFTDMVLRYINTGVMDEFDITIINNDPASHVGEQVMGYYGCTLTGDIPLSILDDEESMLNYDFNFAVTSVARLNAFTGPDRLGS